jgi:Leucine-rich repeat (LRR) protein
MKKGKLSGTIPSSLWTLPKLERIDLDQNSLTGSLPSFNHTQNMTSLKRLDVNFNQLTGSIDPLLFMPNIQVAMLDNNALSGTIPSGIGSLTQLRALTLHGNNLHGTMPESVCQLRKFNGGNLDYLMADCDGKVPKVNCSCCSHCNPY